MPWIACGWLVYRIVEHVTRSVAAAFIAAAVVLTDYRPILAVSLIVERQSSMACLFGLLALRLVTSGRDRPLTWFGVPLLLLASALSKEYGLAFAAAVAIDAFGGRHYRLMVGAVAAAAAYFALRIGLAGGAIGPYCEGGGYFFALREHMCYERLDATTVRQMAYNVIASGIGSLSPRVFTEDGQIALSARRLAVSAWWMACAVVGWRKGALPLRLTALIIGGVAALSFLLYRDRNQVISLCAFAVAVEVGLAVGETALRRARISRRQRLAAAALILCLLLAQSIRTARMVSAEVNDLLRQIRAMLSSIDCVMVIALAAPWTILLLVAESQRHDRLVGLWPLQVVVLTFAATTIVLECAAHPDRSPHGSRWR